MTDEPRCENPDKTLPMATGPSGRSNSDELPSDDRQLAEILDQYLAELQGGTSPDPDDLIRRYPHLAERLEVCLAGLRFIHRAEGSQSATPGQLGDFRLLREIGRGGMGVVYEAEQVSLQRRVAVKILRFAAVSDPEALDRFRREAETVARLHHTNIVPIFFVGNEDGIHYFAMQFIEGRSLADVLAARTNPVDARTVARWGLQAAEALVHAHQRNVIHRDVKPSNLLLDGEDRLWLTDFGLAKRLDDVTLSMTGALLGTPRYMSPEQASAARQRTDHRTDLYSLGATLYEAATGQPVFSATTPHEVIQQILHQEPTPPRRVRPELPRDLETVLLKCLAKQPEQRYADAESLADDLRAILDGRPVRARRASLWERTTKWARRQRRSLQLAIGSAVTAVLLSLAVLAAASAHRQAQTGYVQLDSAGVPLEAEILDADERPVRRFRVPHEEPVALPTGDYRLRLSAPQQMSASYDFSVQRGLGWAGVLASWFSPSETKGILASRRASLTYPVGLQRGRHGEPIDLGTGVVGVLESAARADLVVADRTSIRRIDGKSGQVVWEFQPEAMSAPADQARFRTDAWFRLVSDNEILSGRQSAVMVHPAPDLDQDGEADIVWASRTSCSLLALSGKDGRLLWWHQGAVPSESTTAPEDATVKPPAIPIGDSWVEGQPLVVDADSDGVADLIVAMTAVSPGGVDVAVDPPQVCYWIEAISGRTGSVLWQYGLDATWISNDPRGLAYGDFGTGRRGLALVAMRHHAPQLARLDGQDVVAIAPGAKLAVLRPGDGEPLFGPFDMGYRALVAPKLADIDGDGVVEAIWCGPRNTGRIAVAPVSLKTGEARWQTMLDFDSSAMQTDFSDRLLTAADLDGDGAEELLVGSASRRSLATASPWGELRCLSGMDGVARWTRRLRTSEGHPALQHFVTGPDIDGDGRRDVFVMSFGSERRTDRTSVENALLCVDALSGSDGLTLWTWFQRLDASRLLPNVSVGSPVWWGRGADGWPRLVVPYFGDRSAPAPVLYLLSAGSGRLEAQGAGLVRPWVADLDGDSVPELGACSAESWTARPAKQTLHLFAGGADRWRRLGTWLPTADLDGDRVRDLVSPVAETTHGLTAISGSSGRILWRADTPTPGGSYAVDSGVLQQAAADLNGDGTPDLLLVGSGGQSRSRIAVDALMVPVQAVCGRTGRQLWRAADWRVERRSGAAFGLMATVWPGPPLLVDPAGDGRSDVFLIARVTDMDSPSRQPGGPAPEEYWLLRLDGRNGRSIWRQRLSSHASHQPAISPGRPVMARLSSDGASDLLALTPDGEQGERDVWRLSAVRSLDGGLQWDHATVLPRAPGASGPEPLAGDLDGDNLAEVIVVSLGDDSADGPATVCQVRAIDGRDGQALWSWDWHDAHDLAFADRTWPTPALADISRDGKRSVAVLARNGNSQGIVLLDGRGQVQHRWEAKLPSPGFPKALWIGDLDGDPGDEFVVSSWSAAGPRVDVLQAPDGRSAWSADGSLQDVLPETSSQAATVLVQHDRELLGFDGATGALRWRVAAWTKGFADILTAPTAESPPSVVELPSFAAGHTAATACRRATAGPGWSVESVQPSRPPMRFDPAAADPRLLVPLPWIGPWPGLLAVCTGSAVVVALLPWLAARRWRGPRFSLRQLLAAVFACGLLAWLVRQALTGGQSAPLELLVTLLVRLPLAVLIGLPLVAFAVTTLRCLPPHRWRWLATWLMLAVVSAIGIAAVWLAVDRKLLGPDERYLWDGWWIISLAGAYAAGLAALLTPLVRPLAARR